LPSAIELTPTERPNIALITGPDLRDVRFALRIQRRFAGLVELWLQVTPSAQTQSGSMSNRISLLQRLVAAIPALRPPSGGQREVEQRMFGDEIESLSKDISTQADIVRDSNAPETIARLRKIDPYFILTTESAALGQEVRRCARGLVLSRCDGWLPDYSGEHALEAALYRRDWKKVGSSIVVLGNDQGQIVRRATCCLAEDDTPESCLARSVALGTDLMCDVVAEAMRSHEIRLDAEESPMGAVANAIEVGNLAKRRIRRGLPGLIRSDLDARHRV